MDSSHYYHTLTIFITLIGLCYGGGVLPVTHYGAVGGNVNFTTTLAPTITPYFVITWAVNDTTIVTHRMNQGIEVLPAYQGRVTLDTSTGSLELRNLAMKDNGRYTLSIIPAAGQVIAGITVLQVLEQVSNVVIKASASDVVEFNSSVSLSCSSSGSSPSYHWLKGSSEVTASDNVQLGDGNSTLTIVNVTRYDQGPWRCNVTNLVSHSISQPFNITIYYGPEDTVVEVSPPGGQYVAGSALTLSCSAHSEPVAQYLWFLNGTPLSNEGPELQLGDIQTSQSGSYICQAFNTKTLRYVSSEPSIISVLEKVANVSIKLTSSQPIIEGMSVHLTCAAAGSISTREWMKDGVPLSPSDRVSFSGDNSTVSISPVNRQDSGVYLCRVTNPVSSQDAEYIMTVKYGPDSVRIDGDHKIEVGQKLTLTCLSDSTPTANYSWTVNDTPGQVSQVLIIENIQHKDSGIYNCTASNDITGCSTHAVHTLEVTDPIQPWVIVLIVIAVLVPVAVAVGLTVYFIKKKEDTTEGQSNKETKNTSKLRDFWTLFNKPSSRGRSASSPGAGNINGGGPADQDLNYADVTHFRKKDGGSVQLGHKAAPAESTFNAEVRGRPAPQPGTPHSIYPEDVTYADVSHGGSVQLRHQAAPAESTVYADVRVNGQPTSYTPHLPNSPTKRPAPQPGPPPGPSTYSEVRKA